MRSVVAGGPYTGSGAIGAPAEVAEMNVFDAGVQKYFAGPTLHPGSTPKLGVVRSTSPLIFAGSFTL
jgi:hypothetical protein